MYKIRKAKISDVPKIYKLISQYADKRLMLPRSLNELYEDMQGFFVVGYGKNIIGCCSLGITWGDLAEIKSLAILPQYQNKGLGRRLIKKCQTESKKLGIRKIFVLTYIPEYFKKFGYKRVSKSKLPHKIWSECIRCPFFPNCKEVPLLKYV